MQFVDNNLDLHLIKDVADIQHRFRMIINALYDIGPRNIYHIDALKMAETFLSETLHLFYDHVSWQVYQARGQKFCNIIVEKKGTTHPEEIIVVGAHYDTHKDSPGCNDNGSALAVLIELARTFSVRESSRTIRFVFFVNEEAPFNRTRLMGSRVYARECKNRFEDIAAMICLETLGAYREKAGSQSFSFFGLTLPQKGDFLAVVGNYKSKALAKKICTTLRENIKVVKKIAPRFLPGSGSSDHWSFWKEGFPAVMLSDTAFLRYPHYHKKTDTPEKINYDWLQDVYKATEKMLVKITNVYH